MRGYVVLHLAALVCSQLRSQGDLERHCEKAGERRKRKKRAVHSTSVLQYAWFQ
jgi:hypothetical protein